MWIADGFFTIPRRAARSVGAMSAPAATVRECAGPGQRKSEAPDNEIAFVARRGIKSVVLRSGILRPNEREKFIARLLVVAESAEHGAGDGLAMLFLNAAHLHAQMAGFDDYADALRSYFFLDRFRNLAGHALLNLQPPREHIDQARDFAEAKNALLRQIGHVSLAEERKNVVFAKAEEFDVLDEDRKSTRLNSSHSQISYAVFCLQNTHA